MLASYKKASKNGKDILYITKDASENLVHRILVIDPSFEISELDSEGFDESVIEEKVSLYETTKPSEMTKQRIMANFQGQEDYRNNLEVTSGWQYDAKQKKFNVKKEGNMPIPALNCTKLNLFETIEMQELLQILREELATQTVKPKKIDDSQIAKIQSSKFFRDDTYGLDGLLIKGPTVTKKATKGSEDKERFIMGKDQLDSKNHFSIKINKLTKNIRDPSIWIGYVDETQRNLQNMQQNMTHAIALSDHSRLFRNGIYLFHRDIPSQNHIPSEQDILNAPEKKESYIRGPLLEGQTVTVRVDKNLGKLSWEVNGHVYVTCVFEQMKNPGIVWVPFVELVEDGDSFTWLN